jgi:metallo-beta-lactamase class B
MVVRAILPAVKNACVLFAVGALLCVLQLGLPLRAFSADRNAPVAPFRIAGNIYYVGASDLTSFLITTRQGHILLDGGLPATAPQIERNIRSLGFKITHVKYLINSHAHNDHAGGLAELKRLSGAQLVASRPDSGALKTGDRDDFAWGNTLQFPPVKVDRIIKDGETLALGGAILIAHLTPGHTKGCTTWSMPVTEANKTYNVIFVCSTSAPGYKLVDNPKYPTIIADYEHTFQVLRSLPCDIFLGSHASFFDLNGKRSRINASAANPFVAPGDYRAFLDRSQREFEAAVRQQRSLRARSER